MSFVLICIFVNFLACYNIFNGLVFKRYTRHRPVIYVEYISENIQKDRGKRRKGVHFPNEF